MFRVWVTRTLRVLREHIATIVLVFAFYLTAVPVSLVFVTTVLVLKHRRPPETVLTVILEVTAVQRITLARCWGKSFIDSGPKFSSGRQLAGDGSLRADHDTRNATDLN